MFLYRYIVFEKNFLKIIPIHHNGDFNDMVPSLVRVPYNKKITHSGCIFLKISIAFFVVNILKLLDCYKYPNGKWCYKN